MSDPFTLLGIPHDADDDATVKKAYLQQVKTFSPERHPERFQEIRAAYEQVRDRRGRAACRLFSTPTPDLGLLLDPLLRADPAASRPSVKLLREVLGASVRGFRLTAPAKET